MRKFLESKLFRAIWSIGLAALLYFTCPPCFSRSVLAILLAILLIFVNAAHIIGNFAFLTHILRVFVGGLFIFSGGIKANDTVGFSYKLEEYFEVFKADTGLSLFDWFAHISQPLAVIVCASEVILGIFLLIGYKRNLTLWLLLAQITFFTFLTFYSACYNKVTTCGCFGDFLVLKPWTSFWKDIVFLGCITLLFAGKENINEIGSPMITATLAGIGFVASLWFPIYTYRNMPIKDFRAYAIGENIRKNMERGAGYKDAEYKTLMVYEKVKDNSEKKEMTQDDYMKSKIWEDTLVWKFDTMVTTMIHEAINAPRITDFNISTTDGMVVTDSILNIKTYNYWLVVYDLSKTDDGAELHAKINDFYKLAQTDKIPFVALTASGPKEIDAFKHKHNALYDFLTVDATVLKTMIRSNPGLMLMKDGTVIMNWHYNNFPAYSHVREKYMK